MVGKPGFTAATPEFNHPVYSKYFKVFDSTNGQTRLQCHYKADGEEKICVIVLIKQKDKYYNLKTHLEVGHSLVLLEEERQTSLLFTVVGHPHQLFKYNFSFGI